MSLDSVKDSKVPNFGCNLTDNKYKNMRLKMRRSCNCCLPMTEEAVPLLHSSYSRCNFWWLCHVQKVVWTLYWTYAQSLK